MSAMMERPKPVRPASPLARLGSQGRHCLTNEAPTPAAGSRPVVPVAGGALLTPAQPAR